MVTKDGVYVLDMAAKIDATADYICKAKWGDVEFPPPFGREAYPEVREEWKDRSSNPPDSNLSALHSSKEGKKLNMLMSFTIL